MTEDFQQKSASEDEVSKRLQRKLFYQGTKILAIFALPAIIGMLIGYILDSVFNIAPWGSVAVLLIMFSVSWWFVIKTIQALNKK